MRVRSTRRFGAIGTTRGESGALAEVTFAGGAAIGTVTGRAAGVAGFTCIILLTTGRVAILTGFGALAECALTGNQRYIAVTVQGLGVAPRRK